MTGLLLALAITVLPIKADTPRCPRVKLPRPHVGWMFSAVKGTEAEALEAIKADVASVGGNTLKVTRTGNNAERHLVLYEGYGFRCEGGEAE